MSCRYRITEYCEGLKKKITVRCETHAVIIKEFNVDYSIEAISSYEFQVMSAIKKHEQSLNIQPLATLPTHLL